MLGSLSAKKINPEDITISRLQDILSGSKLVGNCWLYEKVHHTGYSFARIKGTRHPVHRIIATVCLGKPLPDRTVIDHICKNKSCIRPIHIEVVTQAENIKRGTAWKHLRRSNLAKTHCPQGHPYDSKNTYHYKGTRQCLSCRRNRYKSSKNHLKVY